MNIMKQKWPIAGPGCAGSCAAPSRRWPIGRGAGFTLIELLVVIAIMSILASFTLVVLNGISKNKYRSIASAELGQIENALEDFKAKYGVYPPSNTNAAGFLLPQLYYELNGVRRTNVAGGTYYVTLDNSAQIREVDVQTAFGVGGFVNCTTGSGDDVTPAKNFLQGLKQNRIASASSPTITGNIVVSNLVTSVAGPDSRYTPIANNPKVNPIRYVYPGTNNPNSYDLYVQIVVSGQTNLICNWSKAVIKNSPLP